MNRFVIGGILAAIVVLLTGGLNRLFADRTQEPRLTSTRSDTTGLGQGGVSDLGAVPVEQAGQLVRRQSDLTGGGVSATSDSVFGDLQGMPPGGRATISPSTTGATGSAAPNVIPRTAGAGAATTFPAVTGDVAPIQPGLVQPGVTQPRPETDSDLDSIPALW